MKIRNKNTLKKLVKYNLAMTQSVNGNMIISNGDDIITWNDGLQYQVLLEDVTPEELDVAIKLEQLETLNKIKGMMSFFWVIGIILLIVLGLVLFF